MFAAKILLLLVGKKANYKISYVIKLGILLRWMVPKTLLNISKKKLCTSWLYHLLEPVPIAPKQIHFAAIIWGSYFASDLLVAYGLFYILLVNFLIFLKLI